MYCCHKEWDGVICYQKNKLSLSTHPFAEILVISQQSKLKPQSPLDIFMWPCKIMPCPIVWGSTDTGCPGAQVAEERNVVMRRCCGHREHQSFKVQPRWLSKTEGWPEMWGVWLRSLEELFTYPDTDSNVCPGVSVVPPRVPRTPVIAQFPTLSKALWPHWMLSRCPNNVKPSG